MQLRQNVHMLKSVKGVYQDGRIELVESPGNMPEQTRVIVTFLAPGLIDLESQGINEAQAANLRIRLSTFIEEWDSPEMDIYDDYDTAKANL
jgi:N-acetylglucosamine-6-phosphate deacetylase